MRAGLCGGVPRIRRRGHRSPRGIVSAWRLGHDARLLHRWLCGLAVTRGILGLRAGGLRLRSRISRLRPRTRARGPGRPRSRSSSGRPLACTPLNHNRVARHGPVRLHRTGGTRRRHVRRADDGNTRSRGLGLRFRGRGRGHRRWRRHGGRVRREDYRGPERWNGRGLLRWLLAAIEVRISVILAASAPALALVAAAPVVALFLWELGLAADIAVALACPGRRVRSR